MPWLLLSLAAVATAIGPPWGRRAAAQLAAAVPWAKIDAAAVEEVLAAGGNADSPWNKPRTDLELRLEFWCGNLGSEVQAQVGSSTWTLEHYDKCRIWNK